MPTTSNTIEIWAPRFKDLKVLVKPWRIKPGVNRVVFTKTWLDKILLMDGDKMKTYPIEGHGATGVHVIPVKDFDRADTGQEKLL